MEDRLHVDCEARDAEGVDCSTKIDGASQPSAPLPSLMLSHPLFCN